MAKNQPRAAHSSTESKYKVIAHATTELIWLRSLLGKLGFPCSKTVVYYDNIGAIYLTSNPIFHACTKHVELDYHFFRERVLDGSIKVQFISNKDHLGDVFIKPLGVHSF